MNNDACTLLKIIIFAQEKNNNKINKKMRKLVKLLFAVVLTMGVSCGVNAQSVKVGHVDSASIMEIMPERTQLEQELQTYAAELQSEIQAMYAEYQSKAQDYQANEATMSNLIRQSKEKEIVDLEKRIQEFQSNAEIAMQNKQVELLNPIIEKVQNAVNAVGQEQGFTYILDKSVGAVVFIGDNAIDITYSGTTDKPTVLSMTNHAYFSLSGNHAVEGTDMVLYVNADTFTPANENLIPTGEMRPVEGTPFDFRTPKTIGQDINQDYDQLVLGNGYDHNWVLNTAGDINKLAVSVYSPATGILLEEYTDQPGVQVYTGNFLTGEVPGKHGIMYPKRASICIETQLYPNSPNMPEWPSATLRPGETYTHRCIYKFSVK